MNKYEKLAEKGCSKRDLWMRYFTEMTEKTRKPAPELLADPDIAKAIELLEIINYDDIEQELYDRYWDAVSVEATWKCIGERDGEKKGIEIGMKEGLEAGRKEGENNTKIQLARNMLIEGIEPSIVTKITGLTVEEIQNTKRELTRI
jgi:predicted transposase/invertase (TIGR01784 family)